jgi:carboxymethylenebutenolidase
MARSINENEWGHQLAKRDIIVETTDGKARAGLFSPDAPSGKQQPGVILYMDAFGPRPALDDMAGRLASAGYVVLVPDLFYRSGGYGPFDTHTAFTTETTRNQIMGMMHATTQALTERDSGAFIDALAEGGASGPIGVVGYCMGGGRALTAAAAYPQKVAAAASFHGGNLASDAPDSPHLRAGTIAARVYVGSAGVDNSFPPEQSARLAQALREATVDHVIENYVGMAHGWAVPDHGVYNQAGAERHWRRLLEFFGEALH